jgi:hypothetical protein
MAPLAQRGRYFCFCSSVRREQRHDIGVARAQKLERPAVLGLAEAKTAVLLRNLHAEGAELAQTIDDLRRVLPGLIDANRVHLLVHEARELGAELDELGSIDGQWKRMHPIEVEVAQEQLAEDALALPAFLPGGLRDVTRLLLAGLVL